jgi:hypothetical protein
MTTDQFLILLAVLVFVVPAVIGGRGTWRTEYPNQYWGSTGLGLVVLIVVILFLMGRL